MTAYTLHKLWSWLPMYGITLGSHIFLKNPNDQVALAHELVHVKQQQDMGLWFWVAYALLLPVGWNPYRARLEAQAYATDVRAGVPVEVCAVYLSGALYGWCCRRARAEELIRSFL